jgi:hypothetical protein
MTILEFALLALLVIVLFAISPWLYAFGAAMGYPVGRFLRKIAPEA